MYSVHRNNINWLCFLSLLAVQTFLLQNKKWKKNEIERINLPIANFDCLDDVEFNVAHRQTINDLHHSLKSLGSKTKGSPS